MSTIIKQILFFFKIEGKTIVGLNEDFFCLFVEFRGKRLAEKKFLLNF